MKLGLNQSARMEQRLIQSPQMIQAMQILQLSTLGLEDRIEQELVENPFLEVSEPEREEAPQEAQTATEGEAAGETDGLVNMLDELERYEHDYGDGGSRMPGSVDGDNAAAMRYTEVRMDKPAAYLLSDIDKDTVDFQDNYDGKQKEPTVLPARFPNMLVNGAGGIAVGMATNIPPHNLREVIAACMAYIENPTITIDELMEHIPGPDFPTGSMILGRSGIRSAYHTGRGSVIIRAKTHIEENRKDRETIVVTELPYQVNKAMMDATGNPKCKFMHCLPAYRGLEISHDMFDDPRSVAYDEAENRLHAQKALMELLLLNPNTDT